MPIYKTGKTKDGKAQYKVVVNYTDSHGNYRQSSKRVYGSAEAKMEELRLLAEFDKQTVSSSITVSLFYDTKYIPTKKNEVRQTSLAKTDSIIRNHVLPYLGNYRLDKLNSERLNDWKNKISEKDIMTSTKNNAYRELNALLNFAVKMEYLPSNPLKKVGRFRDAYFVHENESLRFYTPDQFKQFIAVAEKYKNKSISDSGFYVFFNIAYYTGMRKGEINALKWSDIEGNLIHVRRSIAQKTKGEDQETPPKNKSSYRTLQMPLILIDILEQHRAFQEQSKAFSTDFRVCGGPSVLRDTSIEQRNTKFAEEAELPHIRIHDFRHSHASLLANAGINIQEIARRLGHSNVQQTWNVYSHLYPREEERAVAILNAI